MNLLAALLHIMVATACMKFSSATCSAPVTCPCGTTGQNITYCSNHLPQSENICERWVHCQQCHPDVNHCTKCPPGYIGPTCSQAPSSRVLLRLKRQYNRYSTRRYTTGTRNNNRFSGGSATCPNLQNTELVALSCTDTRYLRTCRGKCLTGYVFRGREDEKEIEKTCRQGTWSPSQAFPDCVSSGQCEIVLTGQGGGSYNCSMEMEGTRCDVICDGRHQGNFFCYPGRDWNPDLPYCVRPKGGSGEGRRRCECLNGGTCNSNGRCVCPSGRRGTRCEEVYCTDPGSLANAYSLNALDYPTSSTEGYKVGESVYFYCNDGFIMQGSYSITCQTSGKWTRKPTCNRITTTTTTTTTTTPAPVYCRDPGSLANAYSQNMQGAPTSSGAIYQPGKTVWFYCNEGFTMQGADSITCQTSGKWTKKPTCIRQTTTTTTTTLAPVYCRDPGSLANAYSQSMQGTPISSRATYRPGETVWFYCNEGFTMQGADYVTCQTSGRWTRKPTCIRQATTTTTTTTTTPAPVYCTDPGSVANAYSQDMRANPTSSGETYRPGETVWFYCNEGFTMQGADYVTCQTSGRWTRKPTCIRLPTTVTATAPVYCSDPGSLANGFSLDIYGDPTSTTSIYRPRDIVWFYCNEGFTLQGPESVTCLISGRWTRKPTCTRQTTTTTTTLAPVTCPDPGNVRNANRVNINGPSRRQSAYLPGDTVVYTCNSGYVLEGTIYISCLPSGRWSSRNPVCYLLTTQASTTTEADPNQSLCPDPGYIQNGDRMSTPPITSRLQQRGFRLGTQMTYFCVDGYQLQGSDSIFCVYGGKWSSGKPSCESAPGPVEDESNVFCRDPGTILNGKVVVFTPEGNEGKLSDKYLQGTILEYECQDGYQITGSFSISCESDGFWSAVTPSCIEDAESYCDNPGPLTNGQVVISASQGHRHPSITDEGFRQDTRLQFYCDPGHRLIGLNFAICGSDGMWSTSFPYCEKENPTAEELMYCKNPGKLVNGEVQVFPDLNQKRVPAKMDNPEEYPQYTRIRYLCDQSYSLKGEEEITCGVNGFWSARKPTCEGECGKSKMSTTTRITNGKPTVAGQWPWMVAVATISGGETTVDCGGVLIDRRHILTAAHCFDTPGTFELYFGKYHRKAALDDKHVFKRTNLTVTINPHYNSTTYDSDIALVRFSPDVRYSTRIQPICLPTTETTADNIRRGKNGIVVGWGINERNLPSESLFMAFLPVLPGDHCSKSYQKQGKYFPITSNMFCAGFEKGGTSICSGDSGSPMVFYDSFSERYTLEGLVSFGVRDECSEPERYTVITKVLPYLPWVIRTKLIS